MNVFCLLLRSASVVIVVSQLSLDMIRAVITLVPSRAYKRMATQAESDNDMSD
jgi:hypothetical protein